MNAKNVLSKIASMISFSETEVELTYAKLKDGTIVESKTFDVGEELFVVSEDGSKTPAPDGTHELSLKDESGNENLIKVITKDGKIEERENVEIQATEVEPTEEEPTEEAPKEEVDMNKKVDELAYRIEEMEKKMMEMAEQLKPKEETETELEEEDLPKLDGAPIDDSIKFVASETKTNFGQKTKNTESSIYEKLYR
jgi:hypothetical protein